MGRGGKREGAGRRKQERPTNANVAARVLIQVRAEKLWIAMIVLECKRLGIDLNVLGITADAAGMIGVKVSPNGVIDGPDYAGKYSIIPLTNLLRYLEDRAYGRPTENVNHMHDKPLELNHTLSLGEGMKIAMEKAEGRLLEFRRA